MIHAVTKVLIHIYCFKKSPNHDIHEHTFETTIIPGYRDWIRVMVDGIRYSAKVHYVSHDYEQGIAHVFTRDSGLSFETPSRLCMDDSVTLIPLPFKICHALKCSGIETVGEFINLNPKTLQNIQGIGQKSATVINYYRSQAQLKVLKP